MQKENNKLDFTNQTVFVGIDVHKKQWSVTINTGGQQIKTFSMNPSTKELSKYLMKNYPKAKYQSCYEAGYCGYWIDRQLKSMGIENIVVNPADVPTSNKEKTSKTDRIDSRKLARELSSNNLKGIYIPAEEQQAARTLSRLRIQLVKDQTRVKNRIKSLLNFLGVQLPENIEVKYWSGKFIKYIESLNFQQEEVKQTLQQHLRQLKTLREQITEVVRMLRKMINQDEDKQKIITRLMTVPSIGFITAVTLYTEIMDIRRFLGYDHLSSYVGLAPSTYSTGGKEVVLGITQRQNTYLRNILIESAWIASRKDPALTMKYGQLIKRMKKQEAIIRIAKKLLRRIMHLWKGKEDYILAVVE
ncbi:MAG: IS110 family transposase [Stygiobacter sp.]